MADPTRFFTHFRLPRARKTVAFSGAAGNGAVGTVALFTVTGLVFIEWMSCFCTESLAGATATWEVGTSGDTDGILAQGVATDTDVNHWWPSSLGLANPLHAVAPGANTQNRFKGIYEDDIFGTVGTANITDGTLIFDVAWIPITVNAKVVAA